MISHIGPWQITLTLDKLGNTCYTRCITSKGDATMGHRIETWVNSELKIIDVDGVWAETFAYWDTLVDTDLAVSIAISVDHAIRVYHARQGCIECAERL